MRLLLSVALWVLMLTTAKAEPLQVVTTFSILKDLTEQVGGDKVTAETLIGPDQDAHGFNPKPSDIRKLGAAKVIVANGLDFEPWLARAIAAAKAKGTLVKASDGVSVLSVEDGHQGHEHHAHDKHDHGPRDPHAWQNVANTKIYVANIEKALSAADPANASHYKARAAAYAKELDALDAEIKAGWASVPQARRVIVTNHDAFGYYGAAYGVRFLSPIGVSSKAEPSAAGVARLIAQIKREGIKAVFVENLDDPRLIAQIARETGAKTGPAVYSDALSPPNGPAPSYKGMMQWNTKAFVGGVR